MSLNYEYHGTSDTTQWSKDDWQTYNELVWQTIAIDMGKLTEENIYEWVRRCNRLPMYVQTIECKCGEKHTQPRTYTVDELRKFIGLSTNVSTLTANQWATKHFGKRASEYEISDMKRYEKENVGGVK